MNTRNCKTRPPKCLLGAHFSIAGGLHQALYEAQSYQCTAVQIFTKNALTWKERHLTPEDIRLFRQAADKTGIRSIASHTSYLINAAAPDPRKRQRSLDALKQELIRASQLGIPYVVLHPGFHMGQPPEEALCRIAAGIDTILNQLPETRPRLLLETTAGQGTAVGHTFEQLAFLMDKIQAGNRIGICLDTCHIFAAGYDLRSRSAYCRTMDEFDATVGLANLYLLHLNDSQKSLASRIDRHEHIGAGCIGIDAFDYIMNDCRLYTIPKIIEMPQWKNGRDLLAVNLGKLRSLFRKDT